MENLYECVYQVTKERYMEWIDEKYPKEVLKKKQIFWCVIAVLGVACFFLLGNILVLILPALAIYRAFFYWNKTFKRQYLIFSKKYGGENWQRRINFTSEQILILEGSTSVEYAYSDIKSIEENSTCIKLHMEDGSAIRLYENAFVRGNWGLCKEYLKNREDRQNGQD